MDKINKIKTWPESIRDRYNLGLITLRQAAEEMCRSGFTNYIDEDYTRKFLNKLRYDKESNTVARGLE